MPKKLVLPRDPVTGQFLTRKVKDVAEQKNLTGKAARIANPEPPKRPVQRIAQPPTPQDPVKPSTAAKFVGKKP